MKEGTGRGAGGCYERLPPFPGRRGRLCRPALPGGGGGWEPGTHTGRDGPGPGAGRCGAQSGAAQSQESQPNNQVPSRRWFQGNLLGTFFPGTKVDGMYLQGQLPLCCPWAGTQKSI